MAIPESQLETWSQQGSVTQSKTTYATVRGALEEKSAPYSERSYQIFLQGSYGNDTNIYADSDVDIVMMLDSVYYDDLNQLSDDDKAAYRTAFSPASYSYTDFKREVVQHLRQRFGSGVEAGKKAVFVPGSGSRRDCDVLLCAELRRYTRFKSHLDRSVEIGICFWLPDGTRIINFPKQHAANVTAKHQATGSFFKPAVRILKNMRNRMTDRGYLAYGAAPSYFLEGMLYNVPSSYFARNYQNSVIGALDWLTACDHSQLVCANELYFLCHPTDPVTWRIEQLRAYLGAAKRFWQEW